MITTCEERPPVAYFHRELPPLDAEVIGVHSVEATSARQHATIPQGSSLWTQCYDDLMAQTRERLRQEVARLGGDYARVYQESIDSRRDDAAGQSWLHGRFDYVLYRLPRAA